MINTHLALLDVTQLDSRDSKSVSSVDVKRIVTRLNIAASLYNYIAHIFARYVVFSVVDTPIPEALTCTALQPSAAFPYDLNCIVAFRHCVIQVGKN